jgi:plastocyanin
MKRSVTMIAILLVLAACAPQQALQQVQQVQDAEVTAPTQEGAKMGETAPLNQNPSVTRLVDVQIKNFKYIPAVVTINKGDTVRWTNLDKAPHDVMGDDWNSEMLQQGMTSEVTFDTSGEYDYICSVHPSMKGQVIVQ